MVAEPLAGIRQNCDYELALILGPLRNVPCGMQHSTAGGSDKDRFCACQVLHANVGLDVRHAHDFIEHFVAQESRYEACAKSRNVVAASVLAAQHGTRARLDANDADAAFAQHRSAAGGGSARADRDDDGAHRTIGILPDLMRGGLSVNLRVGAVAEGLQADCSLRFADQFFGVRHCATHAIGGLCQHQFSTERTQQSWPQHRRIFRHRQDDAVAAATAHHGDCQAKIAAGAFDDGASWFEGAMQFGVLDHAESGAILIAAARIERFELGDEAGTRGRQSVQFYQWRRSDQPGDVGSDSSHTRKRSLAAIVGQIMIHTMLRVLCSLAVLFTLGACAGVAPSSEEIALREYPAASLTDLERNALKQMELAAEAALAEGQHERARQIAETALSVDPAAARARAVLGVALMYESQRSKPPDLALSQRADGETLAAVRISPLDPVVALLRARCLAQAGHLSAAAAAGEAGLLLQARSMDAEYTALVEATANWCYELGEERRANRWLAQLAQRKPEDAAVQFRFGANLLVIADTPVLAASAARAFARSAELAPNDLAAHCAVIAAYVRAAELAEQAGKSDDLTKFLDAANLACSAAAARFPQSGEPLFRLAVIREQHQATGARAAYESALKAEPEHLAALLNLAALLLSSPELPDQEVAKDLYRRALLIDAAHGGLKSGERKSIEARLKN